MNISLNTERIARFCHRVTYAALLSAIVWIYINLPLAEGAAPPSHWTLGGELVRLIDLPIVIATQALPCSETAVDLWFVRYHCPHEWDARHYLFSHMRVGIPVYVVLFYLPNVYMYGRRRWQRRRSGVVTAEDA